MSHQKFNVARNGEAVGVFSGTDIIAMLASGELQITDFIFDEGLGDWIPLLKAGFIVEQLSSKKPKDKPQKSEVSGLPATSPGKISNHFALERPQWFVLRGRERLGPLRKHDVIRMMQEKVIHSHDFVCKEGDQDWVRLVEHIEFGMADMKAQWTVWTEKAVDDGPFIKRSSPRWRAKGKIIAHNGQRLLWKGEVDLVSLGGIGVRMKNAICLPGEKVYVHVSGIEGMKPFNHACEIVSKEFRKGLRKRTESVGYGLKFLEPSNEWNLEVESWAKGSKRTS